MGPALHTIDRGVAFQSKVIGLDLEAPRLARVTYKINLEQVNGNKPITDADIIPNDDETGVELY